MHTQIETLLSLYQYDPLNRLTACSLSVQQSTQRFYQKDRLATEIETAVQRSIVQHEDQLLAQQIRHNGAVVTSLLATDLQRSVLNALDAQRRPHPLAYTPYGHRPLEGGLLSLLGFNGERPDPVTGHYLLGNGYRAFNPVLMRFNCPDSWSPFGKGGVNAYAYCGGDPFNREDRTGHVWDFLKPLLRSLQIIRTPRASTNVNPSALNLLDTPPVGRVNVPASTVQQWPVGEIPYNGVPARAITPEPISSPLGRTLSDRRPEDVVRKIDASGNVIEMVSVSAKAMNNIRVLARLHSGLAIGEQSSLIRGGGQLDTLPKGQYYKFPNTP